MGYITLCSIGNRSDFPNITRKVALLSHHIDSEKEEIRMQTRVLYFDESGADITHKFNSNNPLLIADNIKQQPLFEADGVTPQLNEDGTPKTIGLYNYLIAMSNVPVILQQLYVQYITINEGKGNFNTAE